MKTTIISIGNSKYIRIPKPLIKESQLGNKVEIKAKRGEIKIVPVAKSNKTINDEYVLSLSSLSDWDTPEEDKAWAHLQNMEQIDLESIDKVHKELGKVRKRL